MTGTGIRSGNAFRGPVYIRTKAIAVLLNADRTHHAVIRLTDTTKDPRQFHRLVGGSVELGERSVDAVVREIGEELGTSLREPRLLGVLENVFVYEGVPCHEVVFLYDGELADPGIVPSEGGWFQDNGEPMFVEWRAVDDSGHAWPLYPGGVGGLVRSLALTHQRRPACCAETTVSPRARGGFGGFGARRPEGLGWSTPRAVADREDCAP